MADRMSVLRGRPSGEAGEISGANLSRFASVRLLGKLLPDCTCRSCCSWVHMSDPFITDRTDRRRYPSERFQSDGLWIGVE
jgi:hypothetical protein